jgi:hypothetical protein
LKQPAGGSSGHTHKHAGKSTKHAHGKAKHNPKHQPAAHHHKTKPQPVHTVAHHPKTKTKRGLAAAGGLNCCAAEAVATSLRLTGAPVTAADVLGLYYRAAGGADAGASIWETLEAACRYGVGGVRPVGFEPAGWDDPAAVILGVDLPGDHAVVADSGQWWSWGTAWPLSAFPAATIEEAWAITWPS